MGSEPEDLQSVSIYFILERPPLSDFFDAQKNRLSIHDGHFVLRTFKLRDLWSYL